MQDLYDSKLTLTFRKARDVGTFLEYSELKWTRRYFYEGKE